MGNPAIGFKVDDVLSSANRIASGKGFRLGQRVQTQDGKQYVYAKNASSNAIYDVVNVNASTWAITGLTTATSGASEIVGVLPAAIASDEYGWVQIVGRTKVKVLGLAAKNFTLWSTTTAGSLDDATASNYMIQGINLLSTNPSSTATALSAFISHPSVLRRAGTA
jgi:hypothetical protein